MQNLIIKNIEELNNDKSLIVGYRTCCGSTHNTQKQFKIWRETLKEIEKQGIFLKSENLTVGNSYATNNGGFWNEIKYTF